MKNFGNFQFFLNKNINTTYYYCSDTDCKDRALIKFVFNFKSEYEKIIKREENFKLIKKHSLDYYELFYNKYKN